MPEMEDAVKDALARDHSIDITTTGRKSGQPPRTEIWYRRADDRFFITGLPGTRSWLSNMKAQPQFSIHLKESTRAELSARARVITDEAERRQVSTLLLDDPLGTDFEKWVAHRPLVEAELL